MASAGERNANRGEAQESQPSSRELPRRLPPPKSVNISVSIVVESWRAVEEIDRFPTFLTCQTWVLRPGSAIWIFFVCAPVQHTSALI